MKEFNDKCNRCGAQLKWDETSLILTCEYCGKKNIIGENFFKIQELAIVIKQVKKYRKIILPLLGISLLIIAYANSKKIPQKSFASYKEAKESCDKWKYRKDKGFEKSQRSPSKNYLFKFYGCHAKFKNDTSQKSYLDLMNSIGSKNQWMSFDSYEYISKEIPFGRQFNSYNRCIDKKNSLLEKSKSKENKKIFDYYIRCDNNSMRDKAYHSSGIYLKISYSKIISRYKFKKI